MKSLITQIPYEVNQPGIISQSISKKFDVTNVYFFTHINQSIDYRYAKGAKYEPIFHNYDYSNETHSLDLPVPYEVLIKLEHKKTLILSQINRWRRNYKINRSIYSVELLYSKLVIYWYNFIKKNNVFAFFMWTPHGVDDTIIFSLCHVLGLFISNETDFRTGASYSRMVITHGLSSLSDFNNESKKLPIDLQLFIDSFKGGNDSKIVVFESSVNDLTQQLLHLFKRFIYHINYKKFRILLNKIHYLIGISLNENRFLKRIERFESNFLDLNNIKFVYFPLHLQPEATTSLFGEVFDNLFNIIATISTSLPEGYRLIVKEHPAFWKKNTSDYFHSIKENRNIDFYREISKLRNVILIEHNYDSLRLIDLCEGVITVSGSVVIESLFKNKYVLLFSDHFYKSFPNVIQYKDLESLYRYYNIIDSQESVIKEDRIIDFFRLVNTNSYLREFSKVSNYKLKTKRKKIIGLYLKLLSEKYNE